MQRLLIFIVLLLAGSAQAQTTLDITVPGNAVCSYTTGPVTTAVTPGHLQATATASSGAGCGSAGGSVGFGPASPLAPAAQTTNNSSGGNPATVTFQAVNAGQCTGTITGAGGGTFNSSGTASATFCTSAATCQTAQTVAMTFPFNGSQSTDNVYTVTATCTGTPSGTANSVATVTVPHGNPVGSCPTIASTTTGIASFTQLTGNKLVNYFGGGSQSVDITKFAAVYKAIWPGTYGLIAQFTLPNANYMSLQFSVPVVYFGASNAPNPLYGDYTIGQGTSGYSAPISMTISTSCGDFSDPAAHPSSTVVSGCYTNKGGPGGVMQWRGNSHCILSDNTAYYLNIINADISNVLPLGGGTAASTKNANCSASSCNDPIEDGPGTWLNYTPH